MKHFERKARLFSGLKTAVLFFGLAGAYAIYDRFDKLSDDGAAILTSAAGAADFLAFLHQPGSMAGMPAPARFRAAYYGLGRTLSSRVPSDQVARAAWTAIMADYYAILPLAETHFLKPRPAAQGTGGELVQIRLKAEKLHALCLAAAERNLETRRILLAQTALGYFLFFLLLLAVETGGYYLLNAPFFENLELLRRKVRRSAEPFLGSEAFDGSIGGLHRAVDAIENALQRSMLDRIRMARESEARQRRLKAQGRELELTSRKVVRLVEDLEETRLELQKEKQALRLSGEKLARSNKELEQFACVAAHDLKEPLRIVSTFSEMLAKRYAGRLDKDADDFIGFITGGAVRATELISALFNYSRATYSAKEFKPVSCLKALEKALFSLKLALEEKRAKVSWDPLPELLGDEGQLVQLFQNLLSNALKFNVSPQPEFRVACRETAGTWLLEFSDNGIGIPAEHFERIFLIFQRLHSLDKYPGTGIGLALCKKIAENHGGRIWVRSTPGEGSVFSVELPKFSPARPPAAPVREEARHAGT